MRARSPMLIQADARAIPLKDGCVQCVVTSPPYWGLRDYGTPGQIGLEGTPDAYVGHLVEVFGEVRRVLTDDGVCFLNLGDSYAGGGTIGRNDTGPEDLARRAATYGTGTGSGSLVGFQGVRPSVAGLKPKDLVGIPWRAAFALQADGWYLRSDIIWHKPNPMPESVTDRPTKAHEYLFLLTKNERYYYDAAAIAEDASLAMFMQVDQGYAGEATKEYEAVGVQNPSSVKARIIAGARKKSGWEKQRDRGVDTWKYNDTPERISATGQNVDSSTFGTIGKRNKRTVWTIATMPYAGAHFATMPEKLVEPCILAGSRFGDLIFDPFSGSGTVLAVAERLGRRAVGTDLNPAYHHLAKARTAQRGLRFEAANE